MDATTLLAKIAERDADNRSIAAVFAPPRDLIERHGFARYCEIEPYKDKEYEGPCIVSSFFRDLWGRSPEKAESVKHGRLLRQLEKSGKIRLLTCREGSPQTRWIELVESSK